MTKRLDRLEDKIDKILEQSVENKTMIDNHIKQDVWGYRAIAAVIMFIFAVHTSDVLHMLNKKSGLDKTKQLAIIDPKQMDLSKIIKKDDDNENTK